LSLDDQGDWERGIDVGNVDDDVQVVTRLQPGVDGLIFNLDYRKCPCGLAVTEAIIASRAPAAISR
jgi:hypothetical protein